MRLPTLVEQPRVPPCKFRQGRKFFPGTNTLAYFAASSTAKKKIVRFGAAGANVIKLFAVLIYRFSYQARVFVRL